VQTVVSAEQPVHQDSFAAKDSAAPMVKSTAVENALTQHLITQTVVCVENRVVQMVVASRESVAQQGK
tara:strand:+ start:17950 stop:18153 length:204 start_codon:yes stop_codon:yes gene_type:complete